jgi:multidrug efflux system outer membrane protein
MLMRSLWLVPASCLLLAGCETNPTQRPESQVLVPPKFYNAAVQATAVVAEPVTGGGLALASSDWWRRLGSDELNRLVDQALANSPELRIATLQLSQAKLRADQVRAGGLPTLTLPIRSAIQAPGGTVGTVPVGGGGASQQSYQASLSGVWRADIWGEQKALGESAQLQVARAVHERENVQRNLIAGVVSSYVSLLALNDTIVLAYDNVAIADRLANTVQQRLDAGDATADEVEQQRAAVFGQQAQIPGLQQQREDVRNSIAQLLGTVPGALLLSDKGLDELTTPGVASGLPSALLLNRPDVRMMESRMRAANADIDVARARMLPPIDLSAQAGYSGLALGQLLQPQNLFWNAIASLTVTIFDGGKREGDKAYAKAFHEEMVETYGRTLFQAIREVESALSTIRTSGLRLEAQQRVTRSALTSFGTANVAYLAGAVDLTTLLDSRRNYQRQLDDRQRIKTEQLRAYVSLNQALGLGVFLEEDSLPHRPLANTEGLGRWEVELSGLYHRSSLAFVVRDVQSRFEPWVATHALYGVFQGSVDDGLDSRDAWFRVRAAHFSDMSEAEAFCAALAQAQRGCRVVAPGEDPAPGQRIVIADVAPARALTHASVP